MEPVFLYQQWLYDSLVGYVTAAAPPTLKGRPVMLPPRQYGAALMQAYLGQQTLEWIAGIIGITLAMLQDWRREPGFLLVMDWSKSAFIHHFRETLLLQDFSLAHYCQMAGEFFLLEESLRLRARIQLYGILRPLGKKLLSLHRHWLRIDDYDLRLFRRLFLFFLVLEHYWPSPAGPRLHQQFLPLAREVVWPLLGTPEWPEAELSQAMADNSPDRIRQLLHSRLAGIFAELPRT